MKVVIGICTYRRDELLQRLLESLMAISWPGAGVETVEVLVVDNDPTVETRQLCGKFEGRFSGDVRYCAEPRAGLVNARNTLITEALGRGADLLALLDDDDVPEPDWLAHLLSERERSGADVVAGNRRFPDERPPSSGKDNRSRSGKLGIKTVGENRVPKGAATANLLITADLLRRMAARGPVFHPDFSLTGGEDEDFFIRAAQIGAQFAIAPQSMVTQYHEPERFSIRGACRRGFKTGCAKLNLARHHEPDKERQLVVQAMGKLCWVAVSLPWSLVTGRVARFAYRMGKPVGLLSFWLTGRSSRYY